MTPKEKAEQLVGYFYLSVTNLKEQKKCANIVVDEIVQCLELFGYIGLVDNKLPEDYWSQVKAEIMLVENN